MALDLSALDTSLPSSLLAPTAPLSTFEEDPNNPRFEFDDPDFENFVEDIRERGILQPVIVRPVDGGKLRIRFGARRYRAAIRLNLPELPYFITEDERQFDDYSQISENEQRKNLQPLELAMFISKKLNEGDKKKVIAAKLKIDPSAITHLLSLVDAPPILLELYHSGKCRAPHYLYELRKMHDKNSKIVELRIAEAKEIDRRFLVAISTEISPPPLEPTTSTSSVENNLNNKNVNNIEKNDVIPNQEQVKNSLINNPKLEHESNDLLENNKLKKPLLLGIFEGREIEIILNKKPTENSLILIRFRDSKVEEEVLINKILLTTLTESNLT